jgi:hypothetical protein
VSGTRAGVSSVIADLRHVASQAAASLKGQRLASDVRQLGDCVRDGRWCQQVIADLHHVTSQTAASLKGQRFASDAMQVGVRGPTRLTSLRKPRLR